MARDFGGVVRGDEGYAKEELVAEIGAAFLCADLGITPEPREDHAAYIGHWLQALKNDKRLIFMAAAHATRAVEYLKARQPAPAPKPATEPIAPQQPTPLLTSCDDNRALYVSLPMEIGTHRWRMRIERGMRGNVTEYEFKDESGAFWRSSREWPCYDINDTYLGLPKGLAKLWEREQPALIAHGLVKAPVQATKQFELKF